MAEEVFVTMEVVGVAAGVILGEVPVGVGVGVSEKMISEKERCGGKMTFEVGEGMFNHNSFG